MTDSNAVEQVRAALAEVQGVPASAVDDIGVWRDASTVDPSTPPGPTWTKQPDAQTVIDAIGGVLGAVEAGME